MAFCDLNVTIGVYGHKRIHKIVIEIHEKKISGHLGTLIDDLLVKRNNR